MLNFVLLQFAFTVLLFLMNKPNILNMFYESNKLLFWSFTYKHISGCGSLYNTNGQSWTKTFNHTKLTLAFCGFLVAIPQIKHTHTCCGLSFPKNNIPSKIMNTFRIHYCSLLMFSICHLKKINRNISGLRTCKNDNSRNKTVLI